MGLPRLTYNGIDVDFLTDLDELDPQYPDLNIKNTAASGTGETLIQRNDVIVRAGLSMEIDPDLKRQLRNWFEWAKKGKPWTFARDRSETVLCQLVGDFDAGDTTIELTDTSGVVVGKQYVLRTDTLLQVVKVASTSAPLVTLEEPLTYDFPSGSRFRSELYWPGRLMSNASPIAQGRVLYGITLDFREDMNDFTLDPPFTGIPDTFEEYEDPGDVNPSRSWIDDGALAIDADADTCAVLNFHSSSSLTPNYANLLISGFPDKPGGLFTTAIIHAITERIVGGSAQAPLLTAGIFNQRNKDVLPSGDTVGHIQSIQSEVSGDIAKTEYTASFTSSEFASNFPGGASDIWLRFAQIATGNFTCSPDVLYKIYRCWIEYI